MIEISKCFVSDHLNQAISDLHFIPGGGIFERCIYVLCNVRGPGMRHTVAEVDIYKIVRCSS